METAIPCTLMRGGTSKGPFFLAEDLPADVETRDRVLLAVMGSPDVRQVDGIGGGDPLTSKVGIVSRSTRDGVDLDFLFAQVSVDRALVDTTPNCGNMLAAVVPFALEHGLIVPTGDSTTARVLTLNTDMLADITVQTPGCRLSVEGECRIDGVPGSAPPIAIDFLEIAGSVCESLLPTGHLVDVILGIPVTCIDNGMPVVVLAAESLGASGYESRDALNANTELKQRLEEVRLQAGRLMGLGDVRDKVVPKMTLVASPQHGGAIATRTFIPHVCHASIGVLGAVSVATACVLPGSVPSRFTVRPTDGSSRLSVEHPTGEFTVDLEVVEGPDGPEVKRAALLRTARRLFAGHVYIPASIWPGH
ncbi:MAG: 4-oxalomesaconate tautomerase [Cytophagaceae bacterium]|nr:4-oxalomesaconate tautomerase [Gemmatimonadaceae bacterium]